MCTNENNKRFETESNWTTDTISVFQKYDADHKVALHPTFNFYEINPEYTAKKLFKLPLH